MADSLQELLAKALRQFDEERKAGLRELEGLDDGFTDTDMPTINLDATNWKSILDFRTALLAALGAPRGYSKNINALLEWMVLDERQDPQPPYMIRIFGTSKVPEDVREEIDYTKQAVARSCAEFRWRKGYSVVIRFETYP